MQQTAINPALAAAMTLESAAQVGEFRPTTPDGQPTVAAQLMQKAMPPTVPQMAQQAGLAAQIQAMQQQQAQQALMQQAMARQQRPAGIEALNPQVGGFAEGGVVGYQGGGSIYDTNRDPLLNAIRESGIGLPEDSRLRQLLNMLPESSRLRQLIDRRREPAPELPVPPQEAPQVEIPIPEISIIGAGPSGGGAAAPGAVRAGIAAALPPAAQAEYDKAFAAQERSKGRDVSAEAVGAEATGMTAAQRAFMKAQGTDPDLLRTLAEEASRRGEERGRYYDTQAEAARRKAKDEGLMNFLLGARGRGFGEVMAGGAQAARGADAFAEAEGQRFMELKFKAQDAAVKDRQLLQKAQFEIDMGQFDKARKTLEEREKNRQTYERAEASARAGYGKELAEYARMIRSQDIQREVGLARTSGEGGSRRDRISALRTAATTTAQEIGKLTGSVRAEDRARLAQLRANQEAIRRELLELGGMDNLPEVAAPPAPTAAGGRPPLSSFQR